MFKISYTRYLFKISYSRYLFKISNSRYLFKISYSIPGSDQYVVQCRIEKKIPQKILRQRQIVLPSSAIVWLDWPFPTNRWGVRISSIFITFLNIKCSHGLILKDLDSLAIQSSLLILSSSPLKNRAAFLMLLIAIWSKCCDSVMLGRVKTKKLWELRRKNRRALMGK